MGKKGWYPKWMANERMASLWWAEQWAEIHGRDNIHPGKGDASVAKCAQFAARMRPDVHTTAGQGLDPLERFRLLGMTIHHILSWVCCSMPVFIIDCDTASMLSLSDCDDILLSTMKWPFSDFVVVLEPGAFLRIGDSRGRVLEVRQLKLQTPCEGGFGVSVVSTDPDHLTGQIEVTPARAAELGTFGNLINSLGEEVENNADLWKQTFRFLGCLSLYLQRKPATRYSGRRGMPRFKFEHGPFELPTDWIITPVPMPELMRKELRRHSGKPTEGIHAPKLKHIVRGHWRMQACGPHHSMRRHTWILPHWRGAGTAITKDYVRDKRSYGGQDVL